jgi:hypothetical protein
MMSPNYIRDVDIEDATNVDNKMTDISISDHNSKQQQQSQQRNDNDDTATDYNSDTVNSPPRKRSSELSDTANVADV